MSGKDMDACIGAMRRLLLFPFIQVLLEPLDHRYQQQTFPSLFMLEVTDVESVRRQLHGSFYGTDATWCVSMDREVNPAISMLLSSLPAAAPNSN